MRLDSEKIVDIADIRSPKGVSRNQKACDGCRSRKSKCKYDEDNDKCHMCILVNIECTTNRPRKKRGPKSRSIIQQGKVDSGSTQGRNTFSFNPVGIISPVSSHSHFLAQVASPCEEIPASVSSGWLSSFAPPEIISQILDDWFDRIHPVAPVLLRRHFMHRLESREADTNPEFCALVVSVCAAARATLPGENYGLVEISTCAEYIDKYRLLTQSHIRSSYSLDWCITMYNLGSAFYSSSKPGLIDIRSYHSLSEAASGVRYLLYYHQHEMDNLENQILRRLFWLIFAGSCTMDILGRLPIILLEQDELKKFPRPLDKTDKQLDPIGSEGSGSFTWLESNISYIPGLNCLIDLLMVWQKAQSCIGTQTVEMSLEKLQFVMDNFPPKLRWRGGLSRPSNVTYGHDVQIANLFVTSLHIRSNLVQRFGTHEVKSREYPKIIDDLLEVLFHLPQAVFDANGKSLAPKIRDIGTAYFERMGISGGERYGGSNRPQDKLAVLLQKLDELDHQQAIDEIRPMECESGIF